MRNHFFPLFKLALIVLAFLTFSNCEKDQIRNIDEAQSNIKNKVQVNTHNNVSKSAIDFIKAKTNNTYNVFSAKGSISLSNGFKSAKNSTLGTVDTSKEIVVINETNVKHTFKVIDNDNDNKTFTNLIVVETENSTYEYFVKYTLNEGVSIRDAEGNLDFSQFRGRIETFNSEGDVIGDILVEDGGITTQTGQLAPCPDEPVDDTNTNTNDEPTDGNSTSSSSTSAGVPGSDTNSSNTTNDNTTSGGWFASSDNDDCGLSWSYSNCGCGWEHANGHAPSGNDCCSGSALVIKDCYGNVIAQGRDANTTTMFKRNPTDPCDDGDIGVILDEEELCAMDNESFNAYYSERSPFTVDMSEVRNICDTITTVENEKFMCVYNKLIKSPTFKNIFNNVFGESQNLNVKFEIVDNLQNANGGLVNGRAIRENYTLDSDGNITNINITIKINRRRLQTGEHNKTPITVARTIIHECIHAYLYVKIINCNQPNSSLLAINDALFEDLMNQYFGGNTNCSEPNGQHDFMIDFMLPTMKQILMEIRDDIIPSNQRAYIENTDFYTISQLPNVNGPLTTSTPFNWNDFYYNLSLEGLERTTFYTSVIGNDPVKKFLKVWYNHELNTRLSKNCSN